MLAPRVSELSYFPQTVSALCYSLIRAQRGPDFSPLHNLVVDFVREQHARLPDYLRLPIVLLTCAFDLSAIFVTARPFHRLPAPRRARLIASWRVAPLAPCRDLIRFYETLVVLGWTSMRDERGDAGKHA